MKGFSNSLMVLIGLVFTLLGVFLTAKRSASHAGVSGPGRPSLIMNVKAVKGLARSSNSWIGPAGRAGYPFPVASGTVTVASCASLGYLWIAQPSPCSAAASRS
jgi:hypothetical protein